MQIPAPARKWPRSGIAARIALWSGLNAVLIATTSPADSAAGGMHYFAEGRSAVLNDSLQDIVAQTAPSVGTIMQR
jgi:hypothetical protein